MMECSPFLTQTLFMCLQCVSHTWHFNARSYTTAQDKGLVITVVWHIMQKLASWKLFNELLMWYCIGVVTCIRFVVFWGCYPRLTCISFVPPTCGIAWLLGNPKQLRRMYIYIHIYRIAGAAQSVQWLGYGKDNWGTVVQLLAGVRDFSDFSPFQSIQTSCEAYLASYVMGQRVKLTTTHLPLVQRNNTVFCVCVKFNHM
jgi:hypothetical protein